MTIKLSLKREFMTKYDAEIKTLAMKHNCDLGVAMDILVAHVRNRNKPSDQLSSTTYYYNFDGCEKLNYEELNQDIKVLEDNFIIPMAI